MRAFLDRFSLKMRLGGALFVLLLGVCSLMAYTALQQKFDALMKDAQAKQDLSLRVLSTEMSRALPDLDAAIAPDGTLGRSTWDAVPAFEDHTVIDQVGQISGETATVFGWDPAEQDFIRLTTNIIKPDGSRAVGTYLGRDNPVYAAIMNGETFRGEAVILGKPYLTIYHPVYDAERNVTGILYVGVERTAIEAAMAEQRSSLLLVSALIVIMGAALMLAVMTLTLRPLDKLTQILGRISGGDEHIDVPYTGRRDEIGRISMGIAEFQAARQLAKESGQESKQRQSEQEIVVSALREALQKLAQQDLSHRIESSEEHPFPAEHEPLRKDFNDAMEMLAATIYDVGDVAVTVRDSAGEIGTLSDSLARRVEQQASTLAESASAITTLSQTASQIADKAEEADKVASKSLAASQSSREALDRAIKAIHDIEQSSEKISRISSVIEDIAFQTNLLALNAGVEAARAGEAGRGFAVVASEVRSLAARAADSAKEITDLIQTSRRQVSEGTVQVQHTSESLVELLGQVEGLGGLVGEIAVSIKEQAQGQSEISTGVDQLDAMTQQNAAIGEEANAAGHALQGEANRLMETLGRFKNGSSQGDHLHGTRAA